MDPPPPTVPFDVDSEAVVRENASRREQIAAVREELTSLQRRQQAILEEWDRLQHMEHEMMNRLNKMIKMDATSPIDRIPTELLSLIFKHHASCRDPLAEENVHLAGGTRMDRRAARMPSMAAYCPFHPKLMDPHRPHVSLYVRYALAHSGELPLTIEIPAEHGVLENVSAAYDGVFSACGRIQEMGIFVTRSTVESFETKLAMLDAPMLERLNITYYRRNSDWPTTPSWNVVLPKLSTLTVTSAPQQILGPLFSSTLECLNLNKVEIADPSELVNLLRQLPSLRKFTLNDVFPVSSNPPVNAALPQSLLHLPCLQDLRLDGFGNAILMLYFVNLITYPATARVTFATNSQFSFAQPQRLPSLIPKFFAPGPQGSPAFQPESVSIDSDYQFWLCNYSFWPKAQWSTFNSPQLTLTFPTEPLSQMICTLFPLLSSQAIVTLRVGVALDCEMWAHAFGDTLDHLVALEVTQTKCAYAFLEVFSAPLPARPGAEASNEPPRYLFPGLKTLRLGIRLGAPGHPRLSPSDFVPRAADMLKRRTQCGLGLSTLIIIMYGDKLSVEELNQFNDPAIAAHRKVGAVVDVPKFGQRRGGSRFIKLMT